MSRVLSIALVLLALTPWAGGAQSPAPAPKVYVGLFRDDAVAVIDTASNRVLRTIRVPKGPHGLVVTPDGRKVYVSSDGDSRVSVIDTSTDQVVTSIDVGPNPHGLAMAPDGRRLLVSAWGVSEAQIVDTATDRIVGRVSVAQAHNGTISADGRVAWVGSQKQGATALVRIDLASMQETARVPLDKTPRALDLAPDGRRLYFTVAGTAAVLVLDTTTNRIVAEIPVGASPHQAPLTADGRWALVPSQGPGELGLIDTATGAVGATVTVGKTPHWVVPSADGRVAYVTNEGSNDVSVVDLVERREIIRIPVGQAPRKIGVQPGPIPKAAARSGALSFSDHGTADVRGASETVLRVGDYYFAPTFLQARPGQTLHVRVENAASTLHNLSVPAIGLDRDVAPAGRIEVVLVIPATGPIDFFCKFHSALGQNGQLIVSPPPPA